MLIKNAHLIDPSQRIDKIGDIIIENENVAQNHVMDGTNLIVMPTLVDMHVHLRDPGYTHKEDIISGTAAAKIGGFSAVVCMPNTNPVCDTPEIIEYIIDKAKDTGVSVYPTACITRNMMGEELTDFKLLKAAGAVAVSDDGKPVKNARLMMEALKLAKDAGLKVISHCEDMDIIGNGIINEGEVSKFLGVAGMSRASEDIITVREIMLAKLTNSSVHIAHVSTKGSVEAIRAAKKCGIRVSAETAPHYMLLTDTELLKKDANYRMNPPLRTQEDVEAVIEGVCDGTIDAIATDHAPHSPQEKSDFSHAPNGILGLETSLYLAKKALVDSGLISMYKLIELMSYNPANILGIPCPTLNTKGRILVFDVNETWTLDKLSSKSRNTPFMGWSFKGKLINI